MVENRLAHDVVARKVRDLFPVNSTTFSHVWMKVSQVMSKDVLTTGPNESVAFAAMRMSARDVSCIIVLDDDRIAGILTETDLLRRTMAQGKDARQTKVADAMSSPVQTAVSDMSVLEASKLMDAKHIKRLPIVGEGRLEGIVTQTDLTRVLTFYGTWKDVSEIMSSNVTCIDKEASATEAALLMASENISSLAVVSGKRAVGIITERDLLKRVMALHKDPSHMQCGKIMSAPVISIHPSLSVFSAGKTMENMGVRRLVVMNEDSLEGIVTQTDIFTAVKNKLQTEEEKNLRLLEESKSPIYVADLNHVVTYANPSFVELLEVPDPKSLIGGPLLAERFWQNPADRAAFLDGLDKGCFQSQELALKTAGGKKKYVTIFSHFITNTRGQISGREGIVYDVTVNRELAALREAEQALRESEKKWRLLAENMPDMLMTVDRNGRIQFLNHAVAGLAPEDVVGTNTYDYVRADHQGIVRDAIEHAFDEAVPQQYEVQGIGEHGPQTWWQSRVVPITEDGRVVAVNLISTDITERRQAEHKQAELLKKVEAVNRELKDFAYIVSHDLKAPLRGIKTLATWICDDYADKFDEQGKEQLNLLTKRVDIMHGLIEGILQYSRVGRVDKRKEKIDLNNLVPQVVDMLDVPEDIDITVEGNLPVIEYEKTRVTQVFENLLSNAVKYMDKPQGRVRIECVEQADHWRFSVADNGPGIREEHFERIFLMFQTLASKDTCDSTGIGLALVKRIVEAYGGTIGVESEPGHGSTFIFTVPKQNTGIKHAELQSSAVG